MRRSGLVLAGLGTCLVVFAVLMVTWVSSQVIKFPLNQFASVTLTDSNASYFSAAKLTPLTGVNMEAVYTIKGNAKAGNSSTAVWNQFLYVYDQTNKLPVQSMTRTFAFDRKTAQLVNCCGANVNGNTSVHQTGYVGIVLPIGTEKKTYDVFDPNIGKSVPFNFAGVAEVGGTEAYKFTGNVPPTQNGTQTVPGSLVNQSASSLTLPQFYEAQVTYWIDPVTGALLNVTQKEKLTLRDSTGAQALLLFDANLAATQASIDGLVAIDNDQLTKHSFVSTLLPLVTGVLGAILLVVGVLIIRRPRAEGEDVEAGRSPGAPELAAAEPEEEAGRGSLVPGLDDKPREATAESPMVKSEAAAPEAKPVASEAKPAEGEAKPAETSAAGAEAAKPEPDAAKPEGEAAQPEAKAAQAEAPSEAEAPTAEMAATPAAEAADSSEDTVAADDASGARRGRRGAHRR
jgi:hypothetical protein